MNIVPELAAFPCCFAGSEGLLKLQLAKKTAREKPLIMRGIPVDRFYAYDDIFFKEGLPVLQGITFPLKKKSFESSNLHLNEAAETLGAPRRRMDARNLSYALR